jgi:hypothetical protein
VPAAARLRLLVQYNRRNVLPKYAWQNLSFRQEATICRALPHLRFAPVIVVDPPRTRWRGERSPGQLRGAACDAAIRALPRTWGGFVPATEGKLSRWPRMAERGRQASAGSGRIFAVPLYRYFEPRGGAATPKPA